MNKNTEIERFPVENKCIYCLTTKGEFTSREHPVAESLISNDCTLPRPYVCDKCNNEDLSRLDNYLIDFVYVSFNRVLYLQQTKQGKPPRANFQNSAIERVPDYGVIHRAKDKSGNIQNIKDLGDGRQSFEIKVRGNIFRPEVLARSLYKIGLGMVAFDCGREQACHRKYDAARDFIRKGEEFPNNLLARTRGMPIPQVRIHYLIQPEGTPFVINLYGLIFRMNLEPTPTMQLNNTLIRAGYASYPLYKQSS
jgi:hypothetical protein